MPPRIASVCSRDVQVELSEFIQSVPDGSTVQFPANGCYAQNDKIKVKDKSGLIINGSGSTFRSSAGNNTFVVAPNWMLVRVRDLTIKNMKIVGNFHLTGPRSQKRVNEVDEAGEANAGNQNNAGISVYGGEGIWISDMEIRNVWGDGVLTGMSEYVEGTAPFETPSNVHVQRVSTTTAERHCFSPNQVVGFWLEDSVGRACWYGAIDAELDDVRQKLQNLPNLAVGSSVDPGAGYRNVTLTWDPSNGADGYDLYLNSESFSGPVLWASTSSNSITIYSLKADWTYPAWVVAKCGSSQSPKSNELILGSGTGMNPPPATCAPPASLAVASAIDTGQGYRNVSLTWAHPGGADSYDVYLDNENFSGPIKWSSASIQQLTLYSLKTDWTYRAVVVARCGSSESANSNEVTLSSSDTFNSLAQAASSESGPRAAGCSATGAEGFGLWIAALIGALQLGRAGRFQPRA